jgi:hypothetical protein
MTQENFNSPFIQKLTADFFQTQRKYIEDVMKIKKLMDKSKLGILSEQLFLILKQKYPVEYNCLKMEKNKVEMMHN